MIETHALVKRFKTSGRKEPVAAIDAVSFTARDGCITGLLGPNGAGKSTTLRVLATLVRPNGGTARVDGLDVVRDVDAVRRQLGFMPHDAGIYPRLSARENIHYYARLAALDKRDATRRTGELVEQLGMQDFADRRAKGFSQGQRTKVALARALVHRPQTVMLDEPTNGLDVMATRGLREILRALADSGHCVLFSSHVMAEVAALCDHIAIISRGQVVMEDRLEQLLRRTGTSNLEDAFVASVQHDPREAPG